MLIFDCIGIKAVGRIIISSENDALSEFIIEKDTASKKYTITWFKHEVIGDETDKNYRELKIVTNVDNIEFTIDFRKLIEKHFATHLKSM